MVVAIIICRTLLVNKVKTSISKVKTKKTLIMKVMNSLNNSNLQYNKRINTNKIKLHVLHLLHHQALIAVINHCKHQIKS